MAALTTSVSPRRSLARAWHGLRRVLASLAMISLVAAATPTPSPEYQVKAVFLYTFAQFVEWPVQAYPVPHAPLIIGILGDDPFGSYLDDLVRDEKIAGHPIVIERYRDVAEVGFCHILFIGGSESAQLERIVPTLRDRSILTVGDAENFSRQGGMVRFVTEAGKIRLRINVTAARACGLVISSKILRPATIVTAPKG